ncbi:hypothetical protein GOP47_0030535 [Adiantum capillus-veneris]|nr:hypothetical protein GOP47_0030535 [Adiantum capillus-veneris]
MQRTLKNLRNTIGAGKFGTPAQDFEEIRLHLHNVALHRRQLRVLVEAVEEEKPLLEAPELVEHKSTIVVDSADEGRESRSYLPIGQGKVNSEDALWEKEKQRSTITASFEDIQENAAVLTVDTRHRKTPALTTVKGIQDSLLAVAKDLEGSRFANHDEQRYVGESKVVVIAGFHSSGCKKPLAEQLLLKSLKNRVHYSTLHGFQVPLSSETLERLSSIPYSRLSLLQGTMEKYPHVEWIWWVPNEALIITDIAFKFPLQMYSEFNFVLLGFVGLLTTQKT